MLRIFPGKFLGAILLTACLNYQVKSQAPVKDFSTADGLAIGLGVAMDVGLRLFKGKEKSPKDFRVKSDFEQIAINNLSLRAKKHSDIMLRGISPAISVGSHFVYDDPKRSIYLSLETIIITDVANLLAKKLLQRPRPFTYNPEVVHNQTSCRAYNRNKPDANLSFYSGHTAHVASVIFFTNSMLWLYKPEYRSKDWAWIASGLLPAMVGYQRVMAGKHFPSDVFAGYLAGAAIGYLIPVIHENNEYDSDLTEDFLLGMGVGMAAQYALIKLLGNRKVVRHDCMASTSKVKWQLSPVLGPYSGLRLSLHLN
jgi:hypothetical protein